jgi:hypothetical protein
VKLRQVPRQLAPVNPYRYVAEPVKNATDFTHRSGHQTVTEATDD